MYSLSFPRQLLAPKRVILGVKLPFRPSDKPVRRSLADEQIDEAIARGDFNNLRGKGKPLQIEGDLSQKSAMRSKIHHDSGFSAPWQEVSREIEQARLRALSSARRAWEFRLAGLRSTKANPAKIEADFALAVREVEKQVGAVNSLILKHNLLIPSLAPRLHRPRLKVGEVWEEVAPEWWATQG